MKGKVGRPKKRRFICEYCGKSFLHSGHFEHHVRTRHEQSQFVCLTCNETYITKEELLLHQKKVKHTGEGISQIQNIVDEIDGDVEGSQVRFGEHFISLMPKKLIYHLIETGSRIQMCILRVSFRAAICLDKSHSRRTHHS